MAINNATTGIDNITQTSGNDDLVFTMSSQNGTQANAGDFFDGGEGIDTIVLPTLDAPPGMFPIVNLRALDATTLRSYEAIRFTANSNMVDIDADAFGNGGLSNNLALTGYSTTGFSTVVVHGANNFSAAGWTFANWNTSGNSYSVQILGTAAADTLTGSSVVDNLAGHGGNDTYYVQNLGDNISESEGNGTDSVYSSVTYVLQNGYGHEIENLTLTGTGLINGTGNDLANTITGNSAINLLYGLGGNDTFDGGLGADKMYGGLGNDTYYADISKDIAIEAVDAGTDHVISSATFKLATNVENLTLTGVLNINGTGNAGNNTILGNAGNNVLNGGVGADTLTGGLGNDSYIVDNIGDVVTEGADAGLDLVTSLVSYTLGANLENLTLTGTLLNSGTGNNLNNKILGNAVANILTGEGGNDVIDGGKGADQLIGGTGDDTYALDNIGDTVTELADEGYDAVTSKVSHTLSANVEKLTLLGSLALIGTGNALDNHIIGSAAVNSLYGQDGNDTLDGLGGIDKMYGGIGDDTYFVDVAGELVSEASNEGTDHVYAMAAHTLSANVENLTLNGTGGIAGTGNALDNIIHGNAGANILTGNEGDDDLIGGGGVDTLYGGTGHDLLDGGIGNDKMFGGAGNDRYYVDSTADVVTELNNEGTDTVVSALAITLGNAVENAVLTGSADVNVVGNQLDNHLIGNDGNNSLNGHGGTDVMEGGLGDDDYWVWDATDLVIEGSNAGFDNVQSWVNYTLGDNVEHLSLKDGGGAYNATSGTGNAYNNVINGNLLNNTLSGMDGNDSLNGVNGNDVLVGGLGADRLSGGTGNDVFDYNSLSESVTGLGIDSITDFTIGDKINVADIDANSLLDGDQAFVMDTDGTFLAGELKVTGLGNNDLRLDFHTDDDGVADMTINVHVNSTFNVTYINELNFVL